MHKLRKIWEAIRYFPLNTWRGLKNLWYYLPVVWADRDWDHLYIEYMLLAKYKKQYKRLDSLEKFVDSKEYNKALRICIMILERRKSDFYTDMWHEREGKYEEMVFTDSDKPGFSLMEFKKTGESPFPKGYVIKMMHQIEERDWKTYCKLVEKYHNHWWD